MKIGVSNVYSCPEFEQFQYFKDCGFDAVDFTLNPYFNRKGIFEDIDFVTDKQIKDHFTALKEAAHKAGVYVCQTHGTFNGHPSHFEYNMDEVYKRLCACIKATHWLGAKYIIIHPIILPNRRYDIRKKENFDRAVEFYRMLEPMLEKYDITCCIENMFTIDRTYRHICATILSRAEEMVDMCNVLGDRYKICLDVGHALVTQDDPVEMVYTIGDKLKALHTHDNDGFNDLHAFPFQRYGKLPQTRPMKCDWEAFMKALKDIGYTNTFSFEINAPGPKQIHPAGLKYLSQIAKYLVNIYDNHNK